MSLFRLISEKKNSFRGKLFFFVRLQSIFQLPSEFMGMQINYLDWKHWKVGYRISLSLQADGPLMSVFVYIHSEGKLHDCWTQYIWGLSSYLWACGNKSMIVDLNLGICCTPFFLCFFFFVFFPFWQDSWIYLISSICRSLI